VPRQAFEHGRVPGGGRRRLVQNHDIEPREIGTVMPEGLPDYTLDPVSVYGFLAVFFRDREAEPREIEFVVTIQNREQLVPAARRLVEHTRERASVQ